MSDGAVMLTAT